MSDLLDHTAEAAPSTQREAETGASSSRLPLAGVRVLDVSQVMAGPYACMLLADLGADVDQDRAAGAGDQTRGAMGFKMKGPDSMGFLNMNRNKRSVTLEPQVRGRARGAAALARGRRHPGRELSARRDEAAGPRLRDAAKASTRGWSTPASPASARPGPGPTARAST